MRSSNSTGVQVVVPITIQCLIKLNVFNDSNRDTYAVIEPHKSVLQKIYKNDSTLNQGVHKMNVYCIVI